MTKNELEDLVLKLGIQINSINDALSQIRKNQNEVLIKEQKDFENINKNLSEKPLVLEDLLLKGLSHAIQTSALDFLQKSTNSLIGKIANDVVRQYEDVISVEFKNVMNETVSADTFKQELKNVFAKKIARAVSDMQISPIDKVVSSLKNDTTFKAKLTIVINDLVKEFFEEK